MDEINVHLKWGCGVFQVAICMRQLTIVRRGRAKYRDLSVARSEQINYLPKPKAEANNSSARYFAIT